MWQFFVNHVFLFNLLMLVVFKVCWLKLIVVHGSVYSFGGNVYGQLGVGDVRSRDKPIKLGLKNIEKVYCGDYSVFAVDSLFFKCYLYNR